MAPGRGKGGYIHMNGQAVAPILDNLRTEGDSLNADWQAAAPAIVTDEAGIGTGPMGAAFGAVYHPEATRVRNDAGRVPVELTSTAEIGYTIHAEYIATDEAAANAVTIDTTYATGI